MAQPPAIFWGNADSSEIDVIPVSDAPAGVYFFDSLSGKYVIPSRDIDAGEVGSAHDSGFFRVAKKTKSEAITAGDELTYSSGYTAGDGPLVAVENSASGDPNVICELSQESSSEGGGTGDNFVTASLSASVGRTHKLNNKAFLVSGNTNQIDGGWVQWVGSTMTIGGGLVGSGTYAYHQYDTGGVDLVVVGATDYRINGSAGTVGQVFTSNGPGVPPTWTDKSAAAEKNIATHDLTYTTDRSQVLDSNKQEFIGVSTTSDGAVISIDTLTAYMRGGDATNYVIATATDGGLDLVFGGTADLKLDGAPGDAGDVMSSAGADDAPVWIKPRKSGLTDLGTLSGAQAVDISAGVYDNKKITASGNITLTISNPSGECYLVLASDDGTPRTFTMPANVKPGGAIVVTSTDGVVVPLHQISATDFANS